MGNASQGSLNSLDEGLRVRHIANFPLITCKPQDDAESLFSRPDYEDLDQLPIEDENRIVGIVERSNPKVRRPLDDSVLVAADNPLSQFIRTIHQQPYRLVVDGTAIRGIVTWSDLLKLPVTVLAFSLVAQLELAMNSRIKEKYGLENDWLELLDQDEKKRILNRLRKLQRENLALSLLELADFSHKAKVLRFLLCAKGGNFERELESLKSLRDEIAHVKEIARGVEDLKRFVERIEIAELWLKALESEQAVSAAARG